MIWIETEDKDREFQKYQHEKYHSKLIKQVDLVSWQIKRSARVCER